MTGLFQPERPDGRSDWRVVYDFIEPLPSGTEITHAKLMAELETEDSAKMYRAVARAKRELWLRNQKSIDSVRGVGYRVLYAHEMSTQAMEYKHRSRKQIGNAVMVSNATNLLELNQEQRTEAISMRGALLAMANAMDQTIRKVEDHEQRIRRLEGGK